MSSFFNCFGFGLKCWSSLHVVLLVVIDLTSNILIIKRTHKEEKESIFEMKDITI